MKKLVIMFPGVGYTMDYPLLYYASRLYEARGYEQIHMKYNSIFFESDLTREEKTLKVREYVWEKVKDIDFSAYDSVVFFSKSFGTAEAGILAEKLGIKPVQIYLTPIPRALPYIKEGDTVVIGTADEVYPECKTYFDEHKHRYNFKVTLKTYLYMIGRSRALDYLKHRKVIAFTELSEASDVSGEEKTLEECVLSEERKRIVNGAIASLPEDMRVVIHLIYFEEMTYEEAAKVMKKNRKQVDNLLYRAKKELRTLLGEEGGLSE